MEIEKSIEVLNEFLDTCKNYEDYEEVIDKEIPQAIEIVLNSLNNYRNNDFFTVNVRYDDVKEEVEKTINDIKTNYISKDKIREKINDLEYNSTLGFEETLEETFKIEVLEELLEEE